VLLACPRSQQVRGTTWWLIQDQWLVLPIYTLQKPLAGQDLNYHLHVCHHGRCDS